MRKRCHIQAREQDILYQYIALSDNVSIALVSITDETHNAGFVLHHIIDSLKLKSQPFIIHECLQDSIHVATSSPSTKAAVDPETRVRQCQLRGDSLQNEYDSLGRREEICDDRNEVSKQL